MAVPARFALFSRGKLPRVQDFLERLRVDGHSFAALTSDSILLGRPVATCPGWSGRDLAVHLGNVYIWVMACLQSKDRPHRPSGSGPEQGQSLTDWFLCQHRDLCARLDEVGQDDQCWTLFPAPSGAQFWIRRQAHETAIHLVDLAGPGAAAFDAAFADDGIDELLLGFSHLINSVFEAPSSLGVRTSDTHKSWTVHFGAAGIEARTGIVSPDCEIQGVAKDLYLALWNREAEGNLLVEGDIAVWSLFKDTMRI